MGQWCNCIECIGDQPEPSFVRGDVVRKRSGSAWSGTVVGEYSTRLTPDGYAVESDAHPGSVQIYPAAALELVDRSKTPNARVTGPQQREKNHDD